MSQTSTPGPDQGQRCPSCGEYEAITVTHTVPADELPDWWKRWEMDEEDVNDDGSINVHHSYCRNCDYGICEHC